MAHRDTLAGTAAFCVALLQAVTAPAFSFGLPACPPPALHEGIVADVTDAGSLLTTDGEEVVLAGLAFPQAIGVTREADGGASPAAAVARFVAGPIRIAATGEADRYGRIRANVRLADGRWLQAELVAAGAAIVQPNGGEQACIRALLAREAAAREARSGLWRDSGIVAKAVDEASLLAGNGLYGLVEGRVVSIGYGSRMVFLDFGRNFRTDFTVMVPKTLVPRLLEAGIAVESLAGRAVRVRGVVEESGGPTIRLADPLELELLDRKE